MTAVHVVVGVTSIAGLVLMTLMAAYGWWRAVEAPAFWMVVRVTQAALLVQAVLGVALLASGKEPAGLHALYGALPLVVFFFAEQLRVLAAEQVLSRLGLEDSKAVGRLPEGEQQAVVLSILRREAGVMALGGVSMLLLVLRAIDEAGGF